MPRALLSVSDKTGLADLGAELARRGFELVSTGGTAKALSDAGLAVTSVSEVTGFPEMMDGRVKTLHPLVHGGILARRSHAEDLEAARAHGIGLVDLVVVNLYPFVKTAARPDVSFDELIERSDVLSLHAPLTDETRGKIGPEAFARMKPGVFLVNTARGGIVDEQALIDALTTGKVAGDGLDVTATEPDVPPTLREHPRALILPHIASATRGTRGGMMRMALENASAVLDGRVPPNAVNRP